MRIVATALSAAGLLIAAGCGGGVGNRDIPDAGPMPDGHVDPQSFQWTEFNTSADTQIIYVSTSDGDDSNDCLSEAAPCRTMVHGETLLRDGFPDWLLLKRGDEWDQPFSDGWNISWTKSGRSADEPMLVSNYGTGPRPLIKAGQEHGFHRFRDNDVRHVAVVGLHFKAHTRDPYSAEYVSRDQIEFQSGFRWTGGGNVEDILIENCKVEFFGSNFAMHPSGSAPPFRNIRVRGNVFYSAWTGNTGNYSQGIYVDRVDGLLIEGNLFDRNGGLLGFTNDPNTIVPPGLTETDVAVTWYNHQAYIQSGNRNVTVINNIFANGDGMQLRPGGYAEENLFTRCINSLTVGSATEPVSGGVYGWAINNVFLEGTDFAPQSATPGVRAHAILLANINAQNGFVVEGNVFSTDMSEDRYGTAVGTNGQDCGSGSNYPCPAHNVSIVGNIVYNWRGGFRFSGAVGAEVGDISVTGNLLQNPLDDAARLLDLGDGFDGAEFSFSGNVYHRGGNEQWFRVAGDMYDLAGWIGISAEAGAEATAMQFTDPDRTLAAYNAAQGGDATHEAFMARAREQCKNNWDPAYEAINVNAWFREGLTASGP